jgi:DNA-binding MarR family transcriptional regulator
MSFSFKNAEDSPGFLMWQLTNQWQRLQRQALADIGLTHGQFVVLASVLWFSSQTKEGVTQNKIILHSKIDKMMMSDLTQTLIRKKLLRRLPHQHDKRSYLLELTAKGRELIVEAIPIVEGIDAKFFSTETPGVVQFVSNLKHLVVTNDDKGLSK